MGRGCTDGGRGVQIWRDVDRWGRGSTDEGGGVQMGEGVYRWERGVYKWQGNLWKIRINSGEGQWGGGGILA